MSSVMTKHSCSCCFESTVPRQEYLRYDQAILTSACTIQDFPNVKCVHDLRSKNHFITRSNCNTAWILTLPIVMFYLITKIFKTFLFQSHYDERRNLDLKVSRLYKWSKDSWWISLIVECTKIYWMKYFMVL